MAEIRSTLDIIMERTKNMTMSDEEKAEFKKQALSGKIRGLAQKYLDGIINLKEITSEIASEKSKSPSEVVELLKKELMDRIDPDDDNEKIFHLLNDLLDMDTEPLEQVIGKFHEDVIKAKAEKIEALRRILREKQITGSAVIPGVDNDASWKAFYESSKADCKKQLSITADRETIGAR